MILRKATIEKLHFPVDGYEYNVQMWTSLDNGETWWYAGVGKYAKTEAEALKIVCEYNGQEEEPHGDQ